MESPTKGLGDTPLLPPPAESFLESHLSHFAEARTRWPLWTGDQTEWLKRGEAWADRIYWSPQILFSEITEELRSHLADGFALTRYLPHEGKFSTAKLGNSKSAFGAFATTRVPVLLQLRVLAVSASFSPTPPESVDRITIPNLEQGGLSTLDLDDLRERFVTALIQMGESVPATLVGRFLKHHLEDATRQDTTESHEALCLELARKTGLVVDRSAGRRNTLSPATLGTLRDEARRIVEAVRSWEPSEEELTDLADLVDQDPNIAPQRGFDPANWTRMLQAQKPGLRERGRVAARASWLGLEAAAICFPFLMKHELEKLSTDDSTVARVANRLILLRYPADISPATIDSTVSRARV